MSIEVPKHIRNTKMPNIQIQMRSWQYFAAIGLVAVIHFGAAYSITLIPNLKLEWEIVPIWPPTGVNVAALVLLGSRILPGIALGHFFFYLCFSTKWTVAAATAFIIMLQAWVAAKLLKRIGFHPALNRMRDVLGLVIVAAPLSSFVGNSIAIVSLSLLSGSSLWSKWWSWYLGDIIAILIVTPVLLTWCHSILDFRFGILDWRLSNQCKNSETHQQTHNLKFKVSSPKLIEFAVWMTLLFGVNWIVFCSKTSLEIANYPLEYLPFTLVIWSAFRFGQTGTSLSAFVGCTIGIFGISRGNGPFLIMESNINSSILYLQAFIAVEAITGLILTATVNERQQSEHKFRELAQTLEIKVQKRTLELEQKNQEMANYLRKLQETQQQLIQSEKMSSLGQLVAGIAHEINNPVNFIHGNLTHINNYTQDLLEAIALYQDEYPQASATIQDRLEEIDLYFLQEDIAKILSSMKAGTERIRQIVLSLRNFSRLDEAEMKFVDIHEGIKSTLLILQHRFQNNACNSPIQVSEQYNELPAVECYASEMNQVFMNIINNAIDALEDLERRRIRTLEFIEPTIWIRTSLINNERVKIEITDNGIGMTPEVQSRIFDPFFTTKEVGKGTGLGLSVSYQIVVEKHQGYLKCRSEVGTGTTLQIEIPIRQQ